MSKSLEALINKASVIVVKLMHHDAEKAQIGIIITQFGSLLPEQIYPLWIEDTKQLKEFLIEALPFEFCACESEDEIPEEIISIVENLKEGSIPELTDAEIKKLNEVMVDAKIRWVGTFNQLCEADSDFAKEIIGRFRNDEDATDPIPQNKRGSFKNFITNEIHY